MENRFSQAVVGKAQLSMKRGRGTLVIGDSANPFYQTSKGACDKTLMMSVGGGMQQPVPRGAGGAAAAEYGERAEGKADVTDFMYRTSSGCYGTNVAPSGNKLAEAMDGPALQPAGSCNPTVTRAYTMEVESKLEMETPSWQAPDRVEKMAGGWQQEQTTQHPMYQTR